MSQDTPPILNELDLSAYWMPFTANRQFKANPRIFVAAEGMHFTDAGGRKVLDGTCGALVRECRPCPPRDRASRGAAAPDARLCAGLPDGPSGRVRTRRAPRTHGARGARPRVLRQFGLRGRGHRAQDRARLSPGARRGPAHALHRTRARLSRRGLRRHVGGRHGQQSAHLRADAARRGPPAAHAWGAGQRLRQGPAAAWRGACGRSRTADRAAWRRHHRGRDRRAHGRLDRRPGPAQGLSRTAATRSASGTACS